MAKIRTLVDLQDSLDSELAWRIKEIADLKANVKSAPAPKRATLIRAGIALLYAHWEGFIKSSSTAYIEYVSRGGHQFSELKNCFVFLGLKKHLNEIDQTRKAKPGITALEFVRQKLEGQARINFSGAINTEANLSSEVFDNIASSIAIDVSPYEAYYNLIDESLLERRNKVAHGEFLDIDAREWRTLADEVLNLIRLFKTDIENNASLGAFKQPDRLN